jgi:hypothetical protein
MRAHAPAPPAVVSGRFASPRLRVEPVFGGWRSVSILRIERSFMAESDEMIDKLADRAKQAKDRVRANSTATKETLEVQVAEARATADDTTKQMKDKASQSRDELQQRWDELRQNWNEHVSRIREKIEAEKAERNVEKAQRRAQRAEDEAVAAISFAYLAIEEAEADVLDAALARAEADELAATQA